MPVPVLPAASATPVLSSAIRLVVSSILAVGVKVAVQVTPPSEELRPARLPLGTVRSAPVKPVTASLKVKVTSEVSPAASAVSATTIVAVALEVSTVALLVSAVVVAFPALSVADTDTFLPVAEMAPATKVYVAVQVPKLLVATTAAPPPNWEKSTVTPLMVSLLLSPPAVLFHAAVTVSPIL